MNYSFDTSADFIKKLLANLPKELDEAQSIKDYLNSVATELNRRFIDGEDIRNLIYARAYIVDNLLVQLWRFYNFDENNMAIFAVGGYGRGELHPYSDLDIIFYVTADFNSNTDAQVKLKQFINLLWSLDLKVAQSIVLKTDIAKLAENITTYTSWLEARQITGASKHLEEFKTQLQNTWSFADFLQAKQLEQSQRYKKYSESDYLLEPNIKKSTGGLRDIHTINWMVLKLTGKDFLHLEEFFSLHAPQTLTPEQERLRIFAGDFCRQLAMLRASLWQIRYALHYLENRAEDRILFNYQTQLAKILGFDKYPNKYGDYNFMQTQLMRHYFGTTRKVEFLNRIFLQNFSAKTDYGYKEIAPNIYHNSIWLKIPHGALKEDPSLILQAFNYLSNDNQTENLAPETWQAIVKNTNLINKNFLHKEENQKIFLQIFRGHKVYQTLESMLLTGVLEKYIKDFGRLMGIMQYDLAHIHAIDKHLLNAVKFLEYFNQVESEELYPLAHEIIQNLANKDRLYLAALFHDIGKGLGGQHALKGEKIFFKFAKLHKQMPERADNSIFFSEAEIAEIAFLIREHLLMSETAQKQDLSEIKFIKAFVEKVGTLDRLNNLYLLTLADISATNPKLWNNWRASLMRQLYFLAKDFIINGKQLKDTKEQINQIKQEALKLLQDCNFKVAEVENLWLALGDDYFTSLQADEVCWQTGGILNNLHANNGEYGPLVLVANPEVDFFSNQSRSTKIFIYAKDEKYIFARMVNTLQKLNLNILEAKINTAENNRVLNSFVVLEKSSVANFEQWRIDEIKNKLLQSLIQVDSFKYKSGARYLSRRQKYYQNWTTLKLGFDELVNKYSLEVKTRDKAGILVDIAQIFIKYNLNLHHAKITTLAERVEDIFYFSATPSFDKVQRDNFLKDVKHALDLTD